ncbi:MAG: hypothetical protein J6T59_00210 [Bacteroidales bacterium]|nr:hypothetical protein [Bacteroidales bacterium]
MKKTIMLVRGAILLVFCFLAVNTTFAQNNQWGKWCYKDYTTTGVTHKFTVPEGCTKVYFEAIGGGGGGGFVKGYSALNTGGDDGSGQMYHTGGGGGGGAYGRKDINSGLTVGETFDIIVGAGGYNTASPVTRDQYRAVCGAYPLFAAWCIGREYQGFWFVYSGADDIWIFDDEFYVYPFFRNHREDDGQTSSVKRNSTNSVILEAYGGKTCRGVNGNEAGAAGGAAGGQGDIHYPGGNGGTGTGRCGGALGDMSSGGGGGAGHPAGDGYSASNGVNNAGGDGQCLMEAGGGAAGVSHGLGGNGGKGTADWALDADRYPRRGQPGENYGGGGGGGKTGTLNWHAGGNGASGIVRVHFYIEAPALSVDLNADPTSLTGPGQTTQLSLNTNAATQTDANGNAMFQTTYQWDPSVPSNLKPTVNNTTEYCVTVTNICIYANDANTCRVVNDDCVEVTVNPVNAGAIAVNPADWVCTPGDTVVTINGSTSPAALATPSGGDYSWQYSSNGSSWSTVQDPGGADYTVVNTTGYYRRGYKYGSNAIVYTDPVQVTRPSDINPGTIKDNNNGTTTNVCSGGNVSVNLSATTSYPVTWQTSTDGTNWTNYSGSVNPLEINGLTTKTYVRYLAKYSTSANPCYVPSNNYYTLNVWTNPVVDNNITLSSTCPNQTSYELTADVTAGSNDNLTYHWGGNATGSGNPGTITPTTTPNCNTPYNYSLYVTDGNGCTSNTVTGDFTTDNPVWNLGAIASVAATHSGTCEFQVPTIAELKAAVDAALTSSCGNEVTLISPSITPAPGTEITSTQNVTATAEDMCGNTHSVTIPVVVPDAPTVDITTTTADDLLLCPGETTTLIAATTAEEPTYKWYPNSLGTDQTATTIAYSGEDETVHGDYYTVLVTDKYGCTGTGNFTVYTTPKAYIAAKEYTICSDNAATMSPASDDKVPAGSSTINSYTFNYNTTYTWIITSNSGVDGATAGTDQANFTTGTLTNSTLETQTVVYSVIPTTTTILNFGGTNITNSCDGAPFTVTVNVKPKVTNTGAITDFDDADVIITLWYGACDTLYNVITPTYTNNILPADLVINLTNDKDNTVNQGTLLGRIAPGEYTIRWTFTDECNNSIYFDKKYIVRYPNCGEDDPNYTEPYRVTYDGYTYTTVRIGCECWLKENLRNQVDADGNNIAVAKVYQNDDSHLNPFGRLYTWYSAMGVTEDDNTAVPTTAQGRLGIYTPGICPEGWAIPKDAQFEDMMTYAHNNTREASSKNQAYWLPGAAGIDPNNGFEAVGAGYYDHYADFYYNLLAETHFWTSTPSSTTYKGKCVTFTHICPEMIKEEMMKGNAISVRCVKIEPKPILD